MTVHPLVLAEVDRAPHWTDQAACREVDTDVFFATDAVTQRLALRICGGCAVVTACQERAMREKQQHGTWGGTTEQDRRRVLRRERRQRSARRRLEAAAEEPSGPEQLAA